MAEDGTYGKPIEYLDIDGESWEENVQSLVDKTFAPLDLHVEVCDVHAVHPGLALQVFSKTPYLCEGDNFKPYYTLKDTIFVLSHRPSTSF
jgi:hypothetical protein